MLFYQSAKWLIDGELIDSTCLTAQQQDGRTNEQFYVEPVNGHTAGLRINTRLFDQQIFIYEVNNYFLPPTMHKHVFIAINEEKTYCYQNTEYRATLSFNSRDHNRNLSYMKVILHV